jgi:hypothetical protein
VTHSTNYVNTFIAVAADCATRRGTTPRESETPSAALLAFRLIHEHPYRFTSDDVLFRIHAARAEIPPSKHAPARKAFFAKPQACLRASDLAKKYGWGIHHDGKGRVALYGLGTPEYARLASGKDLENQPITVKPAMRSRRALGAR